MNIHTSRATEAAVAEGTRGISPEERVAMEWMSKEQRRKLLEAKGFDPLAVAANLVRVGKETVQAVGDLPAMLKGVADVQQASIREFAEGKRDKFGLPPTAVAVGRGVVEAVKGTIGQLRERPGEWMQENPDAPLSLLAGVPAGLRTGGKIVSRAALRRKYAESLKPEGKAGRSWDVEGISEQPYVHRAVEQSLLPGPSGAARPKRPDLDLLGEEIASHRSIDSIDRANRAAIDELHAWEHYRNLDPQEQARLDRAVEQGFTIDAFRGSGAKIEEFDPAWLGSHTNAPSSHLGFFFAKDAETASSYATVVHRKTDVDDRLKQELDKTFEASRPALAALDKVSFDAPAFSPVEWFIDSFDRGVSIKDVLPDGVAKRLPSGAVKAIDQYQQKLREFNAAVETAKSKHGGPNIVPAKLRMDNPYVYDYKGTRYREESYYKVIDKAKKAGHDGVVLKNTYDGAGETDIYVVFDPSQIRSRFAMFHPGKSREKGLIASVAFPMGLTTAAAAYLANREER